MIGSQYPTSDGYIKKKKALSGYCKGTLKPKSTLTHKYTYIGIDRWTCSYVGHLYSISHISIDIWWMMWQCNDWEIKWWKQSVSKQKWQLLAFPQSIKFLVTTNNIRNHLSRRLCRYKIEFMMNFRHVSDSMFERWLYASCVCQLVDIVFKCYWCGMHKHIGYISIHYKLHPCASSVCKM